MIGLTVATIAYLLSQVGDSVPKTELIVAQIVEEYGFELQKSPYESDMDSQVEGYTHAYSRAEMTAGESEEVVVLLDSVSSSWETVHFASNDSDEVVSTNGGDPDQELHSYMLIERRLIWIMFIPSEKDLELPESKPKAMLLVTITGELSLLDRIKELLAPFQFEDSMPQ